jgi:hypothetical protein
MGDLQEEMSREHYTAREAKGLMAEGTLKMLLDHGFESPLYENYPSDQRYYTWEPNNGSENRTGIDWIWTNTTGKRLTAKSGVDRYARSMIKTDHDLLFQDIDVNIEADSSCKQQEERTFYNRVSRIKITRNDKEAFEDGIPKLTFDQE